MRDAASAAAKSFQDCADVKWEKEKRKGFKLVKNPC
jgi:hypothetical protein